MPLSGEYRSQAGNRNLLEELAQITGGRLDPQPRQVFDQGGEARGAVREVGLPLIVLALILLPLDIAVRRLLIRRGMMVTALRKVGLSALAVRFETQAAPVAVPFSPSRTESASRPDPAGEAQAPPAELERLRAAQEAARRRLRGEDADMRR